MTALFFAALVGVSAIPAPVSVPTWRPDACADVAYAPFDTPNVQITDVERRASDVVVKFRVERFLADASFPNVSDRGLIYVQLDDRPPTYFGARTRPDEDVIVAYTSVKPGRHRVAIELISNHRTRPSVAVRCFRHTVVIPMAASNQTGAPARTREIAERDITRPRCGVFVIVAGTASEYCAASR